MTPSHPSQPPIHSGNSGNGGDSRTSGNNGHAGRSASASRPLHHDRSGANVDQLAAEYFERLSAGERPDLGEWLARLDDPARRAELSELIEAAAGAERLLPTPVESRTVLRGRYRILEQIGAGGMGRVFSAWDEELQRTVAVKMLAAFDATDENRRAMFLRESHLLASMQHPNIVAVHEAGTEDGRTFIVMDLVDGRSLADVIAHARKELEVRSTDTKLVPREVELWERAIGKPIPEGRANLLDASSWYETAGRIALELARTLEAAHARGVLHRDLKPPNVMLLGGANPVVLDFGLGGTIEVTEGAVTQGLYGSVAYLAPEQVESYRVGNDPRTDVYQLGLILYEMLTLRRAFPGQSMGEVLDHIKNGEYKPPRAWNSVIPRGLAAVCTMALERDPDHRYATAADMRADLERYFGGREDPLALRASGLRSLARRARWTARRHPVWTAAAGMLLVGLVAAGVSREIWDPKLVTRVNGVRVDAAQRAFRLGPDDLLRVGDALGIVVSSTRPVNLYALWVHGEGESRWVEPVQLDTVHEGDRPVGTWGVRLAEGERSVICGRVDSSADILGVIAWTAEAESRDLDHFLTQALDIGERDFAGQLPYGTAREILDVVLAAGRGKPVLSAAEEADYQARRVALRRQIEQGNISPWSLPEAEARELRWNVEGRP